MKPICSVGDTIYVGSSITVANAAEFSYMLRNRLSIERSLYIDASDLTHVDLTFVQLTVSAFNALTAKGLSFQVGGATEFLRQTFERSGVGGPDIDQILTS